MTTYSNRNNTSAASCFLLGLAAGSALALLYTPFSGAEARGRIKKGIDDGKLKVANEAEAIKVKGEEMVKAATARASNLVDAGKKRVAEEHHRIDSAFQAGKEAYSRA
ncbi:MAG: YtxH domain-containing protein [Bryobacteraceae bacterium]